MRWAARERVPRPRPGQTRTVERYAWFPTKVEGVSRPHWWVWMEHYLETQECKLDVLFDIPWWDWTARKVY
jgi:hypothetical protein